MHRLSVHALALVLAAVTVACAPRSRAGALSPDIWPTTASRSVFVWASTKPAFEEIAIERPERVACELHSPKWSGDLQLRPGGPAFASVQGVDGTLSIRRERGAAFVRVHAAVELAAVVTKPNLYLAKPMALGGFIVPKPSTSLDAPGPHDAGRLNVAVDIREVFTDPPIVRQELPCAAISIVPTDYDAERFVGFTPGEVALERPADLRATPGGSVLARLLQSPRAIITTGAAQAGSRRVVIETREYFAIGWLPKEVLRPAGGCGGGTGRLGSIGSLHQHGTTCSHDLALFAEVSGERARVGTIPATATFTHSEFEAREGFLSIGLPGHWLTPAPGARLLLRKADLDGC